MACYDPAEDPCEKFILVDEAGHNAGFAMYVEELATALFARGARWFPRRRVASVAPRDPGLALTFASGAQATAEKTILNIPQRPLLEIMRGSPSLGLDASAFAAAHAVQTEVVTKLYLYYDVAWWRELGLTSGDFKLDGDAANMPLKGRYHDGDVVCDDEDPATCRGFLLAVYDHDYSGEAAMFFRRYQRERPEPVTILSGATPEGAAFLAHAHERLLECHVYMEDPPYTAYEASTVIGGAAPPTFGVLATWNAATLGAGGGWHGWTDLGLSDAMPAALAAHGAFVVNEAYSLVQGCRAPRRNQLQLGGTHTGLFAHRGRGQPPGRRRRPGGPLRPRAPLGLRGVRVPRARRPDGEDRLRGGDGDGAQRDQRRRYRSLRRRRALLPGQRVPAPGRRPAQAAILGAGR